MAPHLMHVVSPVLVGRGSELEALSQALASARQGHGRCVLVAGEAGVGKSRLLDEVRRWAVREGYATLQGYCTEQDVTFPYSLWVNTLRTSLGWGNATEVQQRLGPLASEFIKIMPELGVMLPDVLPTPPLDPVSEKRRLFEALARFAIQAAGGGPLLITLEDLHWSDEVSLDMLRTFTRRAVDRPILVLGTYRSDEQPPQLIHCVAELNRERATDQLVLVPLTRPEVAEMIRVTLRLDRPPHDEFLSRVMRFTEGNPFFVEEVLKTLTEAGDPQVVVTTWERISQRELQVPSSVYEAVQRRVLRLLPVAHRVLILAAVAGQRFTLELLTEVSALDEHSLLAAIKDLISAQLVVEESAQQLAFCHALTREAIYTSLLLRERQSLHQLMGETMERLWEGSSDAHAAELAYQFYQAAAWEKAFDYSRRAGEEAQRLEAPREALHHFSRAIEAVKRLHRAPSSTLLGGRAHALELHGEFSPALSDYEEALDATRREGDRAGEWASLIDLGFLWQSHDWIRAGSYFERALDVARSLEETSLVASTLNRIGNWHMSSHHPREALTCHQQALALFQSLNDRRGMAMSFELLGFDSYVAGNVLQGVTYFEQAVAIFRELDDRQHLVNALANLSVGPRFDTEVIGEVDLRHLAGFSETALEIARRCDYRKGEADALFKAAMCLCRAGDYGRGIEYLHRATSIAREIEHRELFTTLNLTMGTELYLGILALTEAREHLEAALAAAQELRSAALVHIAIARLALVCVYQNDLAKAQSLLDGVLQGDLPEAAAMTALGRSCWVARAELELALGNPVRALDIVERLLACTANLEQYGPHAVPRLSRLRGQALLALGRVDEAVVELRGTLAVAQEQGQYSVLWQLHADLSRAYLALGRRADAGQEALSAQTIIRQIADGIPDEPLREGFTQRALALVAPLPAVTPRRAAKNGAGGLTERERQIAALIALGKSNREIAEVLVISTKTEERHVANIMSKLGFHSRAQIAAWAVERGVMHR